MARRKGLPRNQKPLVFTVENNQSWLTTDADGKIFSYGGDLSAIAVLVLEHAYKKRILWEGFTTQDVNFSRFHFHWDISKKALLIEPRYADETNPVVFDLIDKMARADSLKAFL